MGIFSRIKVRSGGWHPVRFTDRARKVMALANQEALRLNSPVIDSQHILLGILREGAGVGALALKNMGVDLRGLHSEVERRLVPQDGAVTNGRLPQTERSKAVIIGAIEQACESGDDYVGTQHMLLAMIGEGEGVAGQILRGAGLTLDGARAAVKAVVTEDR